MPLRRTLTRLAIAGGAGARASAVAVTPAGASVDGVGGSGSGSRAPRPYEGVVAAKTPLPRDAANRGRKAIGSAGRGDVVTVLCEATGRAIPGGFQRYRLTSGGWNGASARPVRDLGPSPRRC
ncbi:SH3 domain-containing protein [Streptomyces sp. NPDC014995]|uniref:SH3 domain-containing protein n=1 Tax=Streptomyces sp. NPDC014995 TaxID=3364936 RepID=UPI0037027B77